MEDWVAPRCEVSFMALSTGGTEFWATKRGCQLRQPRNKSVIPGWMVFNTNTAADFSVRIQELSNRHLRLSEHIAYVYLVFLIAFLSGSYRATWLLCAKVAKYEA